MKPSSWGTSQLGYTMGSYEIAARGLLLLMTILHSITQVMLQVFVQGDGTVRRCRPDWWWVSDAYGAGSDEISMIPLLYGCKVLSINYRVCRTLVTVRSTAIVHHLMFSCECVWYRNEGGFEWYRLLLLLTIVQLPTALCIDTRHEP